MRKYVSYACILLVFFMCLVNPVSASDLPTTRINILDLCTVTKTSFSGTKDFYFNYDLPMVFDYVDIVCKFYNAPDSVQILRYDYTWISLDVLSIGNGYYRIYGDIPANDVSNIRLRIVSSSANWVDFYSFYVSVSGTTFDSDCYCGISTIDYDNTIHYVSTDDINYRSFIGTEDIYNMGYQLSLYNLNWQKFDYIDYMLYTAVDSIGSINVTMGGVNVPFEVCYLNNDASVAMDFIYTIRVDCRGLDRSANDYPMVEISGNVITGSANLIAVVACNGIVDISLNVELTLMKRILKAVSEIAPNLTQTITSSFSNLNNWIDDQTSTITGSISSAADRIESAIRGDTAAGDQFQDEVADKDQQLNDMAAVMDSVVKPDLESVDLSADTMVDHTVLASGMSGVTSLMGMPVFFDVIMMSLMLATAGYILYGKR